MAFARKCGPSCGDGRPPIDSGTGLQVSFCEVPERAGVLSLVENRLIEVPAIILESFFVAGFRRTSYRRRPTLPAGASLSVIEHSLATLQRLRHRRQHLALVTHVLRAGWQQVHGSMLPQSCRRIRCLLAPRATAFVFDAIRVCEVGSRLLAELFVSKAFLGDAHRL